MDERLGSILDRSDNVVFFGGAGVSTESGIPDFRSCDGLYSQVYDFPPERILSHSFFEQSPSEFFRFYREKMLVLDAMPNDAHLSLAFLESVGKLRAVITQNIDGLHQKAGSANVLELHGSIYRNFCVRCNRFYPPEFVRDCLGVPLCVCGGVVKPDVVLYEESLDMDVVEKSIDFISKAQVLIVAGTSLSVFPAAGLVRYFRGDDLVVINRDFSLPDVGASLVINDCVGKVLCFE